MWLIQPGTKSKKISLILVKVLFREHSPILYINIQRFLRLRKRNIFLSKTPDSTALIIIVNGSTDNITSVNKLIKLSPLFEFISLIKPTPTPFIISTSVTRKIPLLVWKYAVINIPIRRAVNNIRVWRY